MAFSYSDKNFSVIGNLCFVHIYVDKTGYSAYTIPAAIKERMLIDNFAEPVARLKKSDNTYSTGICYVEDGKIDLDNPLDIVYLNFYFPIDSNK